MKCMNCGSTLGPGDFCPRCRVDVKIYKKIISASNIWYNKGLECAQIRDLSGAVESLKKSLKYYKMNTKARNLLGLVHFEMGDTVDAISQWVISRSLKPERNEAETYLSMVQSNRNRLEALNQAIKKYNQALVYCKQESWDLAIIQLKKVLTINPRLIRGHQLLALLYMREGKYAAAKKALRAAGKIDANNATTLKYMREVNSHIHEEHSQRKYEQKEDVVSYHSGNETIIRPTVVKEHSVSGSVLNILVGAVIGVLITVFLVVPSVEKKADDEANQTVREANDTITSKNQSIKTLESQVDKLEAQIERMEKEKDSSQEVLTVYEQLLVAYDTFFKEDVEGAGVALAEVDIAMLTGKAREIYEGISPQINEKYIETLYEQGEKAARGRNYTEAIEKLLKVIETDETYEEGYAVYYLAKSYAGLDQDEKAAEYYQKVIEQVPGSERGREAKRFLESQKKKPEP